MKFLSHTLEFKTSHPLEILDLTEEIKDFAESSKFNNGILMVSTFHTTTALVINERCEELQRDMLDFLTRLAPLKEKYRHNQVAVDGRQNAHSHLLSLLMSSQQSLILKNSKLQIGPWQSVFLIELDGPREQRKVNLNLMGV